MERLCELCCEIAGNRLQAETCARNEKSLVQVALEKTRDAIPDQPLRFSAHFDARSASEAHAHAVCCQPGRERGSKEYRPSLGKVRAFVSAGHGVETAILIVIVQASSLGLLVPYTAQ